MKIRMVLGNLRHRLALRQTSRNQAIHRRLERLLFCRRFRFYDFIAVFKQFQRRIKAKTILPEPETLADASDAANDAPQS